MDEHCFFRTFAQSNHNLCTMAAIFECTEEKYALNLNPYQIFVFINEKTKPYLEFFKEQQERSKTYEIVLLPFESSEAQPVEDDSIDPQLYNVITHSDVVVRVMPEKFGDYRYMTETFLKRKKPDFDYIEFKWEEFMDKLTTKESQNHVHTIRRFFQYGNQEFSDFVMNVFNGNIKDLLDMSNKYSHMVCSDDFLNAVRFTRGFMNKLDEAQREQLDEIVKDALDYNSPEESKAVFIDFISAGIDLKDNNTQTPQRENKIKSPDFKIVVAPFERKRIVDAKGDYDIQIVKDSGETISLMFGGRGDKMFYLLTLLCQKRVGGLPTKFFSFDSSKLAIKKVYDMMFRSGGDVWVDTMATNTHQLTVSRTHAKLAIEKGNSLDFNTAYWCNLETVPLYIGPKKKKLQVRRVRLPEDRIVINDKGMLTQYLVDLPSLEQVVGYVSPNAQKVMSVPFPTFEMRLGNYQTRMYKE